MRDTTVRDTVLTTVRDDGARHRFDSGKLSAAACPVYTSMGHDITLLLHVDRNCFIKDKVGYISIDAGGKCTKYSNNGDDTIAKLELKCDPAPDHALHWGNT